MYFVSDKVPLSPICHCWINSEDLGSATALNSGDSLSAKVSVVVLVSLGSGPQGDGGLSGSANSNFKKCHLPERLPD
jgi:hypothetical protein